MNDIMRFRGGPLDGQVLAVMPWPPPERGESMSGGYYERISMSELTDEQMAGDIGKYVVRGAEYAWRLTEDVPA